MMRPSRERSVKQPSRHKQIIWWCLVSVNWPNLVTVIWRLRKRSTRHNHSKVLLKSLTALPLNNIFQRGGIIGIAACSALPSIQWLEILATHAADVWEASAIAFAKACDEVGVTRFEEASFNAQPNISIDNAVMEKAEKIVMVPAGFSWSDVGSWDAVAGAYQGDDNGNSAIGADKVFIF